MGRVKAAAWVAAGVTLVATGITGVVAPAQAAPTYRMYVSTHANRSHAASLSGSRLHGSAYIFVKPGSGALRVKFFLDDPRRRHAPTHVESSPPYDLEGGDPTHPIPLKTTLLSNGWHSLTIQVDLSGGKHLVSSASFRVRNLPPKPRNVHAVAGQEQVTVRWASGGGITSGFYVFRSTHRRVPLSHPVSGRRPLARTTHKFVDTHVKPGARYYYVVESVSLGHGRTSSRAAGSGHVLLAPLGIDRLSAYGRDGSVQLHWGFHGVPQQIEIFKGTTAVDLKAPVAKLAGTAHGWTDTQPVNNGTTYRYIVRLVKGSRHADSAPYAVTPIGPPTQVSAVGTSSGVTVSWTHSGTGVTGFGIYRSDQVGRVKTLPASARTWVDPNAVPGTTYRYQVDALSLHGHAESTATTDAARVDVPSGLYTVAGDGTVTVHWTPDGSGVSNYVIYRGTSSSSSSIVTGPHKIGTVTSSTGKWVDANLSNGDPFYYVVQAVTSVACPACAGYANSAVVAGTPITSPILATPSFDANDNVRLSWTTSDEPPVTKYYIFRGGSPTAAQQSASLSVNGSLSVASVSVSSGNHVWSDTSTQAGHTYYYVVQAWYGSGDAESNTVSATPDPPAGVDNLSAIGSAETITLGWDSVDPNATSLEIYRSDTAGQLGDLQATLPRNKLTYADTPLTDGDAWYYTVRTISDGGFTDSTQVSATAGPVGP